MALESTSPLSVTPIHQNGRSFADSIFEVPRQGKVSELGGTSLFPSTLVLKSEVEERFADKGLEPQILQRIAPNTVSKPRAFSIALKELQGQLTALKSKLATVDPDSNLAESLEKVCIILQEKISLMNLLNGNSAALIAG